MAAAEQDGPNYNIVPAENETPITEIAIPKYEAICLGIGRANSNEIRQILTQDRTPVGTTPYEKIVVS